MALLNLDDADSAGIEFPWLKQAVKFLKDQGVATQTSLNRMPAQVARRTFAVSGVTAVDTQYRLKEAVADAVSKGLTGREFQAAVADVVELSAADADRIIRTQTKRAMLSSWDETVKKPVIKKAFPYVMYMPTRDARTRPWHWAMRYFVCEVGSKAYDVCLALQHEYNCRCGFRALTAEQAKDYEIKTYADIPSIVLARGF